MIKHLDDISWVMSSFSILRRSLYYEETSILAFAVFIWWPNQGEIWNIIMLLYPTISSKFRYVKINTFHNKLTYWTNKLWHKKVIEIANFHNNYLTVQIECRKNPDAQDTGSYMRFASTPPLHLTHL